MKLNILIYTLIGSLYLFLSIALAKDKMVFDSWSISCKQHKCYASQMLMAKKNERASVIGGLTFMKLSKNKNLLTVRISKNAEMNSGLGVKVDQHNDIQVKLTQCSDSMCESNIIVDEQLLSELLSGKILAIAFQNKTDNKQISLPFSLKGFSRAYTVLNKA